MNILAKNEINPFSTYGIRQDSSRGYLQDGNVFMVTYISKLTEGDIDFWQNGQWRFGVNVNNGHLLIYNKVTNFGEPGVVIGEYAFHLKRETKNNRMAYLKDLDGMSRGFIFLLVERETNIIKGLRMFGMSSKMNNFIQHQFKIQSTVDEVPDLDYDLLGEMKDGFDNCVLKEKAGTR